MPDSLTAARAALKTVFGYDGFRAGQAEVIAAVLAGRDVFAVMPTGSGKSMCYQLPALVEGGLTVVVSPLIALMRDQVRQLAAAGVGAVTLNSLNSEEETAAAWRALRAGDTHLLFVSRPSGCRWRGCRSGCASSASRVSPSTRPTASRNGATTSGPNTAS